MPVDYVVREDGVATITFNRPETMNSLDTREMMRFDDALRDVRDNPQVKVAILTGAGQRAFCAGSNQKREYREDPELEKYHRAWHESTSNLMLYMTPYLKGIDIWKPLIGAINGHAIAMGAAIVLGCDIRIATPNASFACNETTFADLHDGGGVARLPRQIPFADAMSLLLTGRRVGAQEMLRMHIVSEIVPAERLMPRAYQIAEHLANNCDQPSVQITKQAVIRGMDLGLSQAMIEEALYKEMLTNRHGGEAALAAVRGKHFDMILKKQKGTLPERWPPPHRIHRKAAKNREEADRSG